jgi:predicted  nucleic acid-binding Zn-ribbon protein
MESVILKQLDAEIETLNDRISKRDVEAHHLKERVKGLQTARSIVASLRQQVPVVPRRQP